MYIYICICIYIICLPYSPVQSNSRRRPPLKPPPPPLKGGDGNSIGVLGNNMFNYLYFCFFFVGKAGISFFLNLLVRFTPAGYKL